MWQKEHLTAEMANVVQDGSMLTVFSEKYRLKAVGECDLSLNRLRLSMVAGDCEYCSEWLDVSPLLDRVATVQLLREGLERWLLLATLPPIKQGSGLTPMELTTLLYKQIDHVLA